MEALEIVRWVLAAVLGAFGLWICALNILLLVCSLAGQRMPSHLPLIGSMAVILALFAVPQPLPLWVLVVVPPLLFVSESAGDVRDRAVALIDAQAPGLRATLIRKFVKDTLLFLAAAAVVFAVLAWIKP